MLAVHLISLVLAATAYAGPKPEAAKARAAAPAASSGMAAPQPAELLVDINKASREALKTLPGVGDAEADRIIAARPYKTKAELVTKQALPTGVFLNLKRNVTVQLKPSRPAKAKKLKS